MAVGFVVEASHPDPHRRGPYRRTLGSRYGSSGGLATRMVLLPANGRPSAELSISVWRRVWLAAGIVNQLVTHSAVSHWTNARYL
jgi:hypothetical protein